MNNKSKARILQFIDTQDISKRNFCKQISVSESYFTKDSAMGSDVLENISREYELLSMEWVITGRGKMLFSEKPLSENVDFKEKYYEAIERLNKCLEEKDNLKKIEIIPTYEPRQFTVSGNLNEGKEVHYSETENLKRKKKH